MSAWWLLVAFVGGAATLHLAVVIPAFIEECRHVKAHNEALTKRVALEAEERAAQQRPGEGGAHIPAKEPR